jgi:hypothetical protein
MMQLDWRFLPVIEPVDPATGYPAVYDPWLVMVSV